MKKYKEPCCGAIDRAWFNSLVRKAKARGYDIRITIEFLNKLLEAQDFKCKLSGEQIALCIIKDKNKWKFLNSASLDRINSNGHYTTDNVQFTTKKINMMKQSLSQTEFINLCIKIADHQRKEEIECQHQSVPF